MVLVTIGLGFAILAAPVLWVHIHPGQFASEPGGHLSVSVDDFNASLRAPYRTASVEVSAVDGSWFLNEQCTSALGSACEFQLPTALADVTVHYEGQVWTRRVVAVEGARTGLSIDVEREPHASEAIVGLPSTGQAQGFALFSLTVLAAGVLTWARRWIVLPMIVALLLAAFYSLAFALGLFRGASAPGVLRMLVLAVLLWWVVVTLNRASPTRADYPWPDGEPPGAAHESQAQPSAEAPAETL